MSDTPPTWIISDGKFKDLDLRRLDPAAIPGHSREYRISDLALHLIIPEPLEISKKLVGCEIHYKRKSNNNGFIGWIKSGFHSRHEIFPEIILQPASESLSVLKTPELETHFKKIESRLRLHDPTIHRLSDLDAESIEDIIGVCEDPGGSRSLLTLAGTTDEKISYMIENIGLEIPVKLQRAYLSDGLFEMTGFDFENFNPENHHRLAKYRTHEGYQFQVLSAEGRPAFNIESTLIQYLQLFEQALRSDSEFIAPFRACRSGKAKALKIFINSNMEIDYSDVNLPALYRDLLNSETVSSGGRNAIVDSISRHQIGICLTYVIPDSTGDRLHTNISVLHDVKALEPIRHDLPRVYETIQKQTRLSEAGRFYLLDSIRGFRDERSVHP